MKMEEVARAPLSRAMLATDDVFIVDITSEVFVWVGKGATPAERRRGMQAAADYLKQRGRPALTKLTKVVEGAEPPLFSTLFSGWAAEAVAPTDFSLGGVRRGNVAKRQASKSASELAAGMAGAAGAAEAGLAADASFDDDSSGGKGRLAVWRVEGFEKVGVEREDVGLFYSGDSYVLKYSYPGQGGRTRHVVYFWQGRHSSQDEVGASAILAQRVDDELGGGATQVRVAQGQEPAHFVRLFDGKMVVRRGGKASGFRSAAEADASGAGGVALFHVKGATAASTRAAQVEPRAASLNSGDCFVLLTPTQCLVWRGELASAAERKCADAVAARLKAKRGVGAVQEGGEPAAFWQALGGRAAYPREKAAAEGGREPQLFRCSNAKGYFTSERVPVAQAELEDDDVFLLDTYAALFVWVGAQANGEERALAFETASAYAQRRGYAAETPVVSVAAGAEPALFTAHFLGWDAAQKKAFVDPYEAKLARMRGEAGDDAATTKQSPRRGNQQQQRQQQWQQRGKATPAAAAGIAAAAAGVGTAAAGYAIARSAKRPLGPSPPSPPPSCPDQALPPYDSGGYDDGYDDRPPPDDDYDRDRDGGYDDGYDDYDDRDRDYRDDEYGSRGGYEDGYRGRSGPDSERGRDSRDRDFDRDRDRDRDRSPYSRDRPRPTPGSGGKGRRHRTSSAASIANELSATRELSSTLASITLSSIDFSLHVATAIWCQVDFYGEHSLFWAFITLAVFANMLAIVMFVVRSSGKGVTDDGSGLREETELERKFKERPEECVMVMMFGMINTEFLCFLTPDREDHASFRKLALLSSLAEGIPTLCLQIAFLYEYGWYGLVSVALVWTSITLALKIMRGWIIFLGAEIKDEPRVPMYKNLQKEDLVALPFFVSHSVLILCFIAWLDYASLFKNFAIEWLTLQLENTGGLNATLVGYDPDMTLRIYRNETELAQIDEMGSGVYDTSYDLVPPVLRDIASDMLRGSDDISVEINAELHRLERADPWLYLYDADTYTLTAQAGDVLTEVIELRQYLQTCFGAAVALFVLGCIANFTLLSVYVKMERFKAHFQSDMLWRRSVGTAALGVGTLLNAGFINGFSQTTEGYRIAKRDSAFLHLLFHGIPITAIASHVAARLDCQHKPCSVDFRGSDVETYLYFLIVIAAPIIWWQVARLVMQLVAGRMAADSDDLAKDPGLQDSVEPPAKDRHTSFSRISQAASTAVCVFRWLFGLLGMLQIYFNSAAYTGDRDAYAANLESVQGWSIDPPASFGMPAVDAPFNHIVTLSWQYRLALAWFMISMIANLFGISWFLVRHSTDTLKRRLREYPGGAVVALTLSAMHPELLGWFCDRRDDVFNISKLGLWAAFFDIPLLSCMVATYENLRKPCAVPQARAECEFQAMNETTGQPIAFPHEAGYIDPLLGFSIFVYSVHIIVYASRGIVVTVCARLRRKNEGGFYSYLPNFGDGLTCCVGVIQYLMMGVLVAIYDQGSKYKGPDGGIYGNGMSEEDQDHCFHAMRFLLFTMGISLITNMALSISFLNHYTFSHDQLTNNPFASGMVFACSLVDGGLLDLLSNDPQTDKDIKYMLMTASLATQLIPNFFLQIVIIMMVKVDFEPMYDSGFSKEVFDVHSVVYGSLSLTVIVCVWKLLLVVVLHVTNREREYPYPFHHTPLVFGSQWYRNREPSDPLDYEDDPKRGRGGNGWSGNRRARPQPTGGSWDDDDDLPVGASGASHPDPDSLVEASCERRALFRTPDGVDGVFVFLGDDMPYLFVQVYDIRKQGRGRQMSFTFSPEDVGGLDAEFIEQNITDNPAEAWRSLNGDDADQPAPALTPQPDYGDSYSARGPGGNWNSRDRDRDDSYDDHRGRGGGRDRDRGGRDRDFDRTAPRGRDRDRDRDSADRSSGRGGRSGDRDRPAPASRDRDRDRDVGGRSGGRGPPSIPKLGLGSSDNLPDANSLPPPDVPLSSGSRRGRKADASPAGAPPPPLDLPTSPADVAMTPRTAARAAQRL